MTLKAKRAADFLADSFAIIARLTLLNLMEKYAIVDLISEVIVLSD